MSVRVIEIGTLPRRTLSGRGETKRDGHGTRRRLRFIAAAIAIVAIGIAVAFVAPPETPRHCPPSRVAAGRCPAPSAAPAPVWWP